MKKVVNLRQARKARARADARDRADQNAAKHGRTKAQRLEEAAAEARRQRLLEAHRREDDTGD